MCCLAFTIAQLESGQAVDFWRGLEMLGFQTDERRKKIRKFKESAWKCVYYLSAEIFALTVTYDEPWFTNTRNFWVGPGDQVWPDQKIKLKLKALCWILYIFHICFSVLGNKAF